MDKVKKIFKKIGKFINLILIGMVRFIGSIFHL